jgi:hypothetical protein
MREATYPMPTTNITPAAIMPHWAALRFVFSGARRGLEILGKAVAMVNAPETLDVFALVWFSQRYLSCRE